MAKPLGIDVVHWDGNVDWKKAKDAGIVFAFIKASQIVADPMFSTNWKNAKAQGIFVGAYHYLDFGYDITAQANLFVTTMAGDYGDLPPVVDLEQDPRKYGLTNSAMQNKLLTFMNIVESKTGRIPMLYNGYAYWSTWGSSDPKWKKYKFWQAWYDVDESEVITPEPWEEWTFWQFTDSADGSIYGTQSLEVDLNYFNGTQEELEAFVAGEEVIPTPPEPPDDEGSFMNVLPVKYVSQIMTGALEHNNDCGSAASLMLLRSYDLANDVTVDQFYNSIYPSGDVALSAGQMQSKMASYGLKTTWKVGMTMDTSFSSLKGELPILALIHYAPLVNAGLTEKTGFKGAHFLVITGIDLDFIYVNDPYRTDGLVNNPIPHKVFEDAWAQCVLDGNPVGGAIIPILPIQDLSVPQPVETKYAIISTVNGLNVRSAPNEYSSLVKTIWRATTPYVYCTGTPTWTPPGNPNALYIQLSDLSGWVYYSYLKPA